MDGNTPFALRGWAAGEESSLACQPKLFTASNSPPCAGCMIVTPKFGSLVLHSTADEEDLQFV
jgi:hypothetical protein